MIQVMMFSSTNCVYCDVAKETFASMGTQFKSLEVRMRMLVTSGDVKFQKLLKWGFCSAMMIMLSWHMKNTAKLYGDALVWTVVFIHWLGLFELVFRILSWLDWPYLFDWLTEWMNLIYHLSKILYLIFDLSWSD